MSTHYLRGCSCLDSVHMNYNEIGGKEYGILCNKVAKIQLGSKPLADGTHRPKTSITSRASLSSVDKLLTLQVLVQTILLRVHTYGLLRYKWNIILRQANPKVLSNNQLVFLLPSRKKL